MRLQARGKANNYQSKSEENQTNDCKLILYAVPTLSEIRCSKGSNFCEEKSIDDCVDSIIKRINCYKEKLYSNFYDDRVFTGIIYYMNGIEGNGFIRENSLDFLLRIKSVDKKVLTDKFFNIDHDRSYMLRVGMSNFAKNVLKDVKNAIIKNSGSLEEQENFVYNMLVNPEFSQEFLNKFKNNSYLNESSFFRKFKNECCRFYDSVYLKQEYIRSLMMFVIISETFENKNRDFEQDSKITFIVPKNKDFENEFFGAVLKISQKELNTMENENCLKPNLEVRCLKNPSHSTKRKELFYVLR
ncbi:MAG: hypothetical protein ACP5OZ_02715 [Candidatus Woesearchaeota archaeon]